MLPSTMQTLRQTTIMKAALNRQRETKRKCRVSIAENMIPVEAKAMPGMARK
jgi:hypothetical protein